MGRKGMNSAGRVGDGDKFAALCTSGEHLIGVVP